MTRLQNLVALSTACKTAHDDAVQAGEHLVVATLRLMGHDISALISRLVQAERGRERVEQ